MPYEEKKFNLPAMDGLSKESVEQHLGLYAGYVKNFNAIRSTLSDEMKKAEGNANIMAELVRRLSFEFDGMRLHEYYFQQFEGGSSPFTEDGKLASQFAKQYKSPEDWEHVFRGIASMRGPGWAILYWDAFGQQLHMGFSGEQHQGHFVTLPIVLALDVWEHTYILDYGAGGRGKYLDAFFKNVNWSVVEKRFDALSSWQPK